MVNDNLTLAKGFIKHCKKKQGDIGEVPLEDSVYDLIFEALDMYERMSVETKSVVSFKNELLGRMRLFEQKPSNCELPINLRKPNFNKLRKLTISPICAKVSYNLFALGVTINNSPSQIESYGIKVNTFAGGSPTELMFRLKPIGKLLPLEDVLTIIRNDALNLLDRGLLEIAFDMNIDVDLSKFNNFAKLRTKDEWDDCESVIIDLGLNGLINDCNK